jgi:hypothetical protein
MCKWISGRTLIAMGYRVAPIRTRRCKPTCWWRRRTRSCGASAFRIDGTDQRLTYETNIPLTCVGLMPPRFGSNTTGRNERFPAWRNRSPAGVGRGIIAALIARKRQALATVTTQTTQTWSMEPMSQTTTRVGPRCGGPRAHRGQPACRLVFGAREEHHDSYPVAGITYSLTRPRRPL